MIETKEDGGKLKFHWSNGVYMGYAYVEVDGYYVFVFNDERLGGCFTEDPLRAIADKLFQLNEEWDDKVKGYFSNKNDTENFQDL